MSPETHRPYPLRAISRNARKITPPSTVSGLASSPVIRSGWNWTEIKGIRACSTDSITPPSDQAAEIGRAHV